MNKQLVLKNREDFKVMKGSKLLRLLRQSYVDFEELVPRRMQRQLQKDWYDWCTYWDGDYIMYYKIIPGTILRIYYKDNDSDEYMMSNGLVYTNLNPNEYYCIEIVDEVGGPDQFRICCAYPGNMKLDNWYDNHKNPRRKKFSETVKTMLQKHDSFTWTTKDEPREISIIRKTDEEIIITTTNTGYGDKEYVFTKRGEIPNIYIPRYYIDEEKLALSKIIGVAMELLYINTTPKIFPYFRFEDRILSVTEEKEKEERIKYELDSHSVACLFGHVW